jgi:hypothetical protein
MLVELPRNLNNAKGERCNSSRDELKIQGFRNTKNGDIRKNREIVTINTGSS